MFTYSLAQWLVFFYMYCFLGWVWETCYVSIRQKRFINRGFLHGPFLPIYGSGAICVLFLTLPVKENLVAVFCIGMLGATILEYITGAVMERLFGVRYWDYSQKPFNLNGHICLGCSLGWGGFSILMVRFLHLPFETIVLAMPKNLVDVLAFGGAVYMTADTTLSVHEALNLKEVLKNITENSKEFLQIQKRMESLTATLEIDKEKYMELAATSKERFQGWMEREASRSTMQSMKDWVAEAAEKAKESAGAEKVTEELSELKLRLTELMNKMSALTNRPNRDMKKSITLLKRNPNAISKEYALGFKELSKLLKKEKETND